MYLGFKFQFRSKSKYKSSIAFLLEYKIKLLKIDRITTNLFP